MLVNRKVRCLLCGKLLKVPYSFDDFPCPACGAKIHDPHKIKGDKGG